MDFREVWGHYQSSKAPFLIGSWLDMQQKIGPETSPHRAATIVLNALGVYSPPVDVHAIVKALGVTLTPVVKPGWSGACRTTETSASIWLDSQESELEQRFTLAHELGHVLLHPLGMEFRDISFKGSKKESEANHFAASLLLPLWMLDPLTGQPLKSLVSTFQTSEHFIGLQVAKLNGEKIQW